MILEILIPQLIPLYILIAMGFVSARHMDVNLHSMAIISIYFLAPVVIFGAIARMEFQTDYLVLPLVLFILSFAITLGSYSLAQRKFKDRMANVIGLASATSNSGYFGLPIILALYGPEMTGIYLLGNFGAEIVAITLAYYFGARGNLSVRESLIKVFRLPILYAIILGLLWNVMNLPLPAAFLTYWDYFTGAWVVIGMMLTGVALGKLNTLRLNLKLSLWLGCTKFIIWPLAVGLAILIDIYITQMFPPEIYGLFIIWSLCPLPNNAVAFSAQLKIHPEEVAMTTLASTIFAFFYIPLMIWLLNLL